MSTNEPDQFHSATYGNVTLVEIRTCIITFMAENPEAEYKVVIGTDSQPKNGHGTDFVTAIVVHRVGSGGIYFWKRVVDKKKFILRTRMYQEASYSLSCAQNVVDTFRNDGISTFNVEIHVDIGKHGETRDMISEIVGMVRGSGFAVKTKPHSYAASKVADRHT